MCSEQFFEVFAGHGARPLSTTGCAPSTNAITAAERRSARPRFRHSTTCANCGLPPGLARLPARSRAGFEGKLAHRPLDPTKTGQSISFSPVGSGLMARAPAAKAPLPCLPFLGDHGHTERDRSSSQLRRPFQADELSQQRAALKSSIRRRGFPFERSMRRSYGHGRIAVCKRRDRARRICGSYDLQSAKRPGQTIAPHFSVCPPARVCYRDVALTECLSNRFPFWRRVKSA